MHGMQGSKPWNHRSTWVRSIRRAYESRFPCCTLGDSDSVPLQWGSRDSNFEMLLRWFRHAAKSGISGLAGVMDALQTVSNSLKRFQPLAQGFYFYLHSYVALVLCPSWHEVMGVQLCRNSYFMYWCSGL